jgi:hypothetical protein
MEYFCRHGPGAIMGQPVHHGDEYTGLIVDIYALGDSASNNHMLYDSVFFSRPKASAPALFPGWGPGLGR